MLGKTCTSTLHPLQKRAQTNDVIFISMAASSIPKDCDLRLSNIIQHKFNCYGDQTN